MAYPAYWHNAYYNQFFYSGEKGDFSCQALDSNAYSTGIPAGDLAIAPIWQSYGYNFSTPNSHSALIKDENDTFYFLEYRSSVNTLYFQIFNEEEEVDVIYEIDAPEGVDLSQAVAWFIRKKSETEFDFLAYKWSAPESLFWSAHLVYTIDSSATFVSEDSWTDIGQNCKSLVLIGNRMIGIFVYTKEDAYGDEIEHVNTFGYNLDSHGYFEESIYSHNKDAYWYSSEEEFDCEAVLAGDNLYILVPFGEVAGTRECTGYLGAKYQVITAMLLHYTIVGYGVDGSTGGQDTVADYASGYCAKIMVELSGGCGDPGNNFAYFKANLTKHRSGSSCIFQIGVPPWPAHPEFVDTRTGIVVVYGATFRWNHYHEWTGTIHDSRPVYEDGICNTNASGSDESHYLSTRGMPLSRCVYGVEDNIPQKCIFNWMTNERFFQSSDLLESGFSAISQRNDIEEGNPLFCVREYTVGYGYDAIFYDLNQNEYAAIRQIDYPYDPPNGFMGKWPITIGVEGARIWGSPFIESDKGVFVQTVELDTSGSISDDPSSELSLGEPEDGDLAAWNIFEYPTIHANDIYLDHHHYHSPVPDDYRQTPIWNGTKWETGYIFNPGEGEYGWEDHWHIEEDIADLLHDATHIHGVQVIDDPVANEYLMYNESSGSYVSNPLASEKSILGLKQIGITSSGSLADTGAIPTRLLSPWNGTIQKVSLSSDPPGGQSIIVDVNKNGTTIFTDQDNRPTIAAGDTTGDTTDIDINSVSANDVFTIDVDQIGTSGSPGGNLAVFIVVNT